MSWQHVLITVYLTFIYTWEWCLFDLLKTSFLEWCCNINRCVIFINSGSDVVANYDTLAVNWLGGPFEETNSITWMLITIIATIRRTTMSSVITEIKRYVDAKKGSLKVKAFSKSTLKFRNLSSKNIILKTVWAIAT